MEATMTHETAGETRHGWQDETENFAKTSVRLLPSLERVGEW